MADEPLADPAVEPGDRPLAHIAEVEAQPEYGSPRDRLRAFEDEHLGKDCVRIDGNIERGVGSTFANLSPEQHAHYAALERLIVAHDKLEAAQAALVAAEQEAAEAEIAADAAAG